MQECCRGARPGSRGVVAGLGLLLGAGWGRQGWQIIIWGCNPGDREAGDGPPEHRGWAGGVPVGAAPAPCVLPQPLSSFLWGWLCFLGPCWEDFGEITPAWHPHIPESNPGRAACIPCALMVPFPYTPFPKGFPRAHAGTRASQTFGVSPLAPPKPAPSPRALALPAPLPHPMRRTCPGSHRPPTHHPPAGARHRGASSPRL